MNRDTLGNTWPKSTTYYQLFDKYIDLYFFQETEQTYEANIDKAKAVFAINCPITGPKPDIEIEFSALEGGIVYGLTITVKNMNLHLTTADLRSLTFVMVDAGYRTNKNNYGRVLLKCPIFASYKSEPSPDSTTVFQCVVVGTLENIFDNVPIDIGFYKATILKDFLQKTIEAFGGTAHLFIEDAFANATVDIPHRVYHHSTGFAAFNWLQTMLDNIVFNYNTDNMLKTGRAGKIQMFIFGNDVYVAQLDAPASSTAFPEQGPEIFHVDTVNSVDFNGGTATVKAPWVPGIHAGGIFRLSPTLYTGNNLVNEIKESTFISKYDCYWIIKMRVTFGTVNGNEMELLAIPIENSNFMGQMNKTNKEAEQKYSELMNSFKRANETAHKEINFGEPTQNPVKEDKEGGSQPKQGNVFSEDVDISGVDYTIQPGDSLEKIARKFYADMPYYRNNKVADKRGGIPPNGYGPTMFWPLIIIATNTKVKQLVKSGKTENEVRRTYDVNTANPNAIKEGKHLIVPSLSGTLANYKQYHAVFTKMGEFYKELGTSSYGLTFSQIGEMLEGED